MFENSGFNIGSDGISFGDFSYTWGEEDVESFEDPGDDLIQEEIVETSNGMMFSPLMLVALAGVTYLIFRKK